MRVAFPYAQLDCIPRCEGFKSMLCRRCHTLRVLATYVSAWTEVLVDTRLLTTYGLERCKLTNYA